MILWYNNKDSIIEKYTNERIWGLKVMDKDIIVALITAVSAIIVALIGIWKKKSSSDPSINVKQTMGDGDGNTQIGVQNNGEK